MYSNSLSPDVSASPPALSDSEQSREQSDPQSHSPLSYSGVQAGAPAGGVPLPDRHRAIREVHEVPGRDGELDLHRQRKQQIQALSLSISRERHREEREREQERKWLDASWNAARQAVLSLSQPHPRAQQQETGALHEEHSSMLGCDDTSTRELSNEQGCFTTWSVGSEGEDADSRMHTDEHAQAESEHDRCLTIQRLPANGARGVSEKAPRRTGQRLPLHATTQQSWRRTTKALKKAAAADPSQPYHAPCPPQPSSPSASHGQTSSEADLSPRRADAADFSSNAETLQTPARYTNMLVDESECTILLSPKASERWRARDRERLLPVVNAAAGDPQAASRDVNGSTLDLTEGGRGDEHARDETAATTPRTVRLREEEEGIKRRPEVGPAEESRQSHESGSPENPSEGPGACHSASKMFERQADAMDSLALRLDSVAGKIALRVAALQPVAQGDVENWRSWLDLPSDVQSVCHADDDFEHRSSAHMSKETWRGQLSHVTPPNKQLPTLVSQIPSPSINALAPWRPRLSALEAEQERLNSETERILETQSQALQCWNHLSGVWSDLHVRGDRLTDSISERLSRYNEAMDHHNRASEQALASELAA